MPRGKHATTHARIVPAENELVISVPLRIGERLAAFDLLTAVLEIGPHPRGRPGRVVRLQGLTFIMELYPKVSDAMN